MKNYRSHNLNTFIRLFILLYALGFSTSIQGQRVHAIVEDMLDDVNCLNNHRQIWRKEYTIRLINENAKDMASFVLDCDNDLYATTMDDDDVLNEGATAFNDWAHCDINIDLNGDKLLYKENCFTEAERNAIASSKISSHEYVVGNNAFEVPQGIKYYFGSGSTPLTGEKLFILDAEDIVNSAYGYYSSMGAGENRVKYVLRQGESEKPCVEANEGICAGG